MEEDFDDKSKNMSYSKNGSHSLLGGNSNFSINSEKNENPPTETKETTSIQLTPLELESFYERVNKDNNKFLFIIKLL